MSHLWADVLWLRLQVKKLKAQLEQKAQKNGTENTSSPDGEILENGTDPNIIELQSKFSLAWKQTRSLMFYCLLKLFAFAQIFPGDSSRQISDMKFKLVKAEQEVTALEQNVSWEEFWIDSVPKNMTSFSLMFVFLWSPGGQTWGSGDTL